MYSIHEGKNIGSIQAQILVLRKDAKVVQEERASLFNNWHRNSEIHMQKNEPLFNWFHISVID